jgi:MFS family permease
MKRALIENWSLFLGMILLMIGNGLLVTLLTIRGASLGFSDFVISLMQAAYPLGALAGTILAPKLIENVGHIRSFSALASVVSVAAIVHLLTSDPYSWSAMRFVAGVCFPGLYVITESWLNAKSENSIRAQVLSIYFITTLAGPAIGTAMVGLPDPSGTLLFGIVSILISIAIVPLLLSNVRAPDFTAPDRMPVARLMKISPMAVFGIVMNSIGVSAWFIGLPLYALANGFDSAAAALVLVAAMAGGAFVQFPVGWISNNTDRRYVVIGLGVIAILGCVWVGTSPTLTTIWIAFTLIAAMTLPTYSILVAHANDQLTAAQIVPASGTMGFLMQVGQFIGILIGPNMISVLEGRGLPAMIGACSLIVVLLGITRRVASEAPEETTDMQPIGVIGLPQPGLMQAEVLSEDLSESER